MIKKGEVREEEDQFQMVRFKAMCKGCGEEVGVYDYDQKRVSFKEVVPNFIG